MIHMKEHFLLQRNGREGQFVAAAAILSKLQEHKYDVRIAETLLRAVTSSYVSPPLALWILVTSFRQFLAAAKGCSSQEAFSASDHWIVAQVAVALLLLSEENQDWEGGLQVLFCLHAQGTHYVGQPMPTQPSRDLAFVSRCTVALTALRICLENANPSAAMEVLKGCDWVVGANNEEESQWQVVLVTALLDQCACAGMLQDAHKCFLSLLKEPTAVLLAHSHALVSACNKFIEKHISACQVEDALEIYRHLDGLGLYISAGNFSSLLEGLVNKGRSRVACELCQAAIARGLYPPLPVNGKDFVVCIPVHLCRVEVFYLLEDHLHKLALLYSLQQEEVEPLDIIFSPGETCILSVESLELAMVLILWQFQVPSSCLRMSSLRI